MESEFTSGPSMLDSVSIEQLFSAQSRKRSEKVGYYRRPRNWEKMPAWITWNQTQPQIRFPILQARGFEPLPQYGNTPPPSRDNPQSQTHGAAYYGCAADDSNEIWTPILAHSRGPAEFPAAQVQYQRWYRPEGLPGVMMGRKVRFPQFEEMVKAQGGLREYHCPDCTQITFFRPAHLARHLHNSHGYDQAAIIALGQASGIDFNEGLMSLVESLAVWEVPESNQEQEMSFTPPPTDVGVAVVETLILPNQSQVRQAQEQVLQVREDPALMRMIADLQQQIADLKIGLAESVKAKPVREKPLTEAQLAHLEKMREARAEKAKGSGEPAAEEPEPALA